nr:hypothetical protein [Tanacetum cinerariifolium]
VDLTNPSYVRQGDDARMAQFVRDLNSGAISAVFFYNANPVYNHPQGAQIKAGIAKTALSVSLNDRLDETGSLCQYQAPDSHWLESWNDYEPKRGFLSLAQPAITPIFKTRQGQESFLRWAGSNENYYNFLKDGWRGVLGANGFQTAWDKVVHDGVATGTAIAAAPAFSSPVIGAAEAVSRLRSTPATPAGSVEVALYEKVGVAKPLNLPVLIQPGQADDTVSIAVGYGRMMAGRVGDNVGENAFPLAQVGKDGIIYANNVTLKATGANSPIAQTQ